MSRTVVAVHMPVLVLIPDATDGHDAYIRAETLVAPFCGEPVCAEPTAENVCEAVDYFAAQPMRARTGQLLRTPVPDRAAVAAVLGRMLDTAATTSDRASFDPVVTEWVTAALGAWMANDPDAYAYDVETGRFVPSAGPVECDGWVLGGQYANQLRLHTPVPVAVVEHAWGLLNPALVPSTVSPPRAGLGTPEGAMTFGLEPFGFTYDADRATTPMPDGDRADVARRDDIDPESLRDLLNGPVCVLADGKWTSLDAVPPNEACDLRAAVLDAAPSTWIAVLDAHM